MITGGCGFIGSNFIHFLLGRNDYRGRVLNVDCLTYAGNPENLVDVERRSKGRYVFLKADVRDKVTMASIFQDYKIDAVCHFAAESHVDRSIRNPDSFVQTNIVGSFNLLELSKGQKGFKLFHHVSTDEVYGSLGEEGHFTETTPYRPNSPYSASKAASDHLVRAYHKTYGLPVTVSNCSNNYGPFQFPEKLIPLTILNALEGKSLPVYGDGKNVRDWLYVTDHCEAIWRIMCAGVRGETYNVGGEAEMENITIVQMICDILDESRQSLSGKPRRELITFVQDRPGHDRRYAIDFSKLRDALGWTPKVTFYEGLRRTIAWYLDNQPWVERVRSGEYLRWIKEHYEQ